MNEERFKTLFKRYLEDNISTEELLEFQYYIQDERYSDLFNDMLAVAYSESTYVEENPEARQKVLNNLMSEIHWKQKNKLTTSNRGRLISLRRLAGIAAMLFIALGAGLFFYLNNHKGLQNSISVNDIKPGVNKATLTLSNGTKVILSDALQGQLSNEAGIKVSKTQNGEIVYTVIQGVPSAQNQILFNTLSTARHEQYRVVLPDGSHVWLNSASSLKYPITYTGKERKVELSGEAYFEVAHNAVMPFRVKTTTQEVEVLGTHFNIKSYADEQATKTTLLEGSVRLSSSLGMTKILRPGQQAINSGSALNVNNVDTEESVAWKNGYFMFDNEDLGDVMRKICRWYDVEVAYDDPNQAKQVFAGSITRYTNVLKVLEMLEKAGNVHFKIEGRKIIVTK